MQVGHRRQRVRARVHGAQVLLERDRAHHRAHQHVGARLRGRARSRTAIGSARAAMRTPSSAMPSHSGWYAGDRYDSTLCVSASMPVAAVIARRQVERQLGIGEHGLREQLRREDDLLDVRRVVGDHRRAADLRARAGGRGQRDEVGQRRGRSGAPADGPTRIRGCRPDASPSARSPWRRRAPRRRPGRSTAVGAMRLVRGHAVRHLASHRIARRCRENTATSSAGSPATNPREQRQRAMPRSVTISGRARLPLRSQVLGDEPCARRRRNGWWSGKAKRWIIDGGRECGRQLVASTRNACRVGTASASDDLEVALQFPVGDRVQPLPPFPFARRGEVVDEIVAEPVARDVGLAEDPRRLDQRARRARNVLRALVGAVDRLGA